MMYRADDPAGRIQDDVEEDHAQRDALAHHAQQHEDVGHHHRGEQLEEVLDPQMHHPEAPEVGDGEGLLRVAEQADRVEERDRQGAIRVFPGANLASKPRAAEGSIDIDETVDVEVPPEAVVEPADAEIVESAAESAPVEAIGMEVEPPPVADAEVIAETDEDDEPQPNVTPEGYPVGGAKTKRGGGAGGRGGRKTSGGSARPSRGSSKPRARKRSPARD